MDEDIMSEFRELYKEMKSRAELEGMPLLHRIDTSPCRLLSRLPSDSPLTSLDFDKLAREMVDNIAMLDEAYDAVLWAIDPDLGKQMDILQRDMVFPYRLLQFSMNDSTPESDRDKVIWK